MAALAGSHAAATTMQYLSSLVNKPDIEISLQDEQNPRRSCINTFSTLERIEGTATIRCPSDTPFDRVEIAFIGEAKTWIEKMTAASSMNGRSEAHHRFLRLTQPIPESSYPSSHVADANQTYRFPFTFVVPPRLLPSACKHRIINPQIQDEHIQLPPSLGDPELCSNGNTLPDDMAPEMTRVKYSIQVRLIRSRERDGKVVSIAGKSKKIRIVPTVEEAPPLSLDGVDGEYRLRHEKSIKKGLLKGKLGRLVMEAEQTKSLHIPHPHSAQADSPVTTLATVLLRFDPSAPSTPPPALGSLTAKLKATTSYACKPLDALPTKAASLYDVDQAVHIATIPLSSRCMGSTQWTSHDAAPPQLQSPRRGSSLSTLCPADIPAPSRDYHNTPFHTARLLVPITLPTSLKTFVPTFHSCLISRTYALDLSLSAHGAGIVGGPTLNVRVPVQISTGGSPDAEGEAPDMVGAEHGMGEEFFEPRIVGAVPQEFVGRSRIGSAPGAAEAAMVGGGEGAAAAAAAAAGGGRGRQGGEAPPGYSYLEPRGGVVPVCG